MAKSEALARFESSMIIDYEKWHDGIGYDLEALERLTPAEKREVADLMRRRLSSSGADWRDAETAVALGDASLIQLARQHREASVREVVATEDERRDDVIEILRRGTDDSDTLRAIDDIPMEPDAEMRETLLWCCRHSPGVVAYHAAGALMQIYAGVEDPWDIRPFLLEFTEEDTRTAAYEKLLAAIG